MRFLVDENLPIDVVEVLEEKGHDVLYVGRSSLSSKPDEALNAFAIQEGRVIITKDLDFPLQGVSAAKGVVILRTPYRFARSSIRQLMLNFMDSPEFPQVEGYITVVSPGRIRNRSIANA